MNSLSKTCEWVCVASLQATVLIALVLALQAVLRKRIPANWCWALWFVVVLRLSVPWLPESPTSVFNAMPIREPGSIGAPAVPVEDNAAPAAVTASPPTPARRVDVRRDVIPAIWLSGALALALASAAQAARLSGRVRRSSKEANERTRRILAESMQRLGLHGRLQAFETRAVPGPALFGFLRPRLLLPEGFESVLSDDELSHIFLHELAHVKRRDILVNWLMSAVQFVHWFNPAVWYAFHRVRMDRELACDALALSVAQPGDTAAYGRTLLKVLTAFSRPVRLAGLVGVIENKSQLKRRIVMIATFKPGSRLWTLAAVAVVTALAAVALTNAQTQAPSTESKLTVEAKQKPAEGKVVSQTVTTGTVTMTTDDKGKETYVEESTTSDIDPETADVEKRLQKRLPHVEFEGNPFASCVDFLRATAGINIAVDRHAEPANDATVTLKVDDVSVKTVLDLLTMQHNLKWIAWRNLVYISDDSGIKRLIAHAELRRRASERAKGESREVEEKMYKRIAYFDFTDQPLAACFDFLRTMTDVNVVVDGHVPLGPEATLTLRLENATAATLLDIMTMQQGLNWAVKDNYVYVSDPATVRWVIGAGELDVWAKPEDIQVFDGEYCRFLSVTIHNDGPEAAALVPVWFYQGDPEKGGTIIAKAGLPDLKAGKAGGEAVPWDAPAGNYEIYVVLDPEKTLPEAEVANNRTHATVTIKEPFTVK